MENKITTYEEYNQKKKEGKIVRNEIYNLKIDLFMNKNNLEKSKLLEDKYKILKSKYTRIAYLLKKFEKENNIEIKKEGKKK